MLLGLLCFEGRRVSRRPPPSQPCSERAGSFSVFPSFQNPPYSVFIAPNTVFLLPEVIIYPRGATAGELSE